MPRSIRPWSSRGDRSTSTRDAVHTRQEPNENRGGNDEASCDFRAGCRAARASGVLRSDLPRQGGDGDHSPDAGLEQRHPRTLRGGRPGEALGQPVVGRELSRGRHDDRNGEVTQAEPDGYARSLHSSAPSADAAAADNLAFDITDLQPIAVVATGDMVFATGSRVPLPTLQDVVKQAETAELFHATAGTGTGQLLSELFDKGGRHRDAGGRLQEARPTLSSISPPGAWTSSSPR